MFRIVSVRRALSFLCSESLLQKGGKILSTVDQIEYINILYIYFAF
jgi:hypothetical protein